MSGTQTSVNQDMRKGMAGQLADARNADVESAVNAEESEELRFGTFVAQGSDDKAAIKLSGASDKLKGVAVRSHGQNLPHEIGDNGYKPEASVGVLAKGTIWVQPENELTPSTGVHVRHSGSGNRGAVRGSAVANETLNISKFCTVLVSGDANTPAKIKLDMTMRELAEADS